MDSAWIESVITRKERENEILKVLNFETDNDSVPDGENCLSVIRRLKLEMILVSGKRVKKSFVVKVKLAGNKAGGFEEFELFKTEVKVYENIFRQMEYLMDEFEDNREKLWCQMYGYQPYNLVVFEDLKELGYEISERRHCLDWNHAKLFLRSIGRFHAMSRILIERGLLSATDLQPFYFSEMRNITKNMIECGTRHLSKIVLNKWPEEWKDFGLRLEKLHPVIVNRMKNLMDEDENREEALVVLNHGDSWTTNMMFKYSDDGIPSSIRLLDFQMSNVGSYIWDVLYFLYTSVKPETRRAKKEELIKTYWESLDSNLRRYGYQKFIPSLNDVLKEAERKDLFSFFVLAVFHPAMTFEFGHGFDVEKAAEGVDEMFKEEALNSTKFRNECGEDFKYFMNKGVF